MRRASSILAVILLMGGTTVYLWPLVGGGGGEGRTPEQQVSLAQKDAASATAVLRGHAGPEAAAPVDWSALDRDRDVHGFVIQRDGARVAGAQVQIVYHPWRHQDVWTYDGWSEERLGPETRTRSDGSFSLRVGSGDLVAIRVSAEGCAVREVAQVHAGARLRIVVAPAVLLVVLVRDTEGGAVPNSKVRVFKKAHSNCVARQSVSNAAGRCEFDGLPAGTGWYVEADHDELGNSGWRTRASLPASGSAAVTVTMPEGHETQIRVTDRETEEPIKGVRIRRDTPLAPWVVTDSKGECKVTGLGDRTELFVDAPGYVRNGVTGYSDPWQLISLRRSADLVGRVVDERGRAVASALVSAFGDRRDGNGVPYEMDSAKTTTDGTFRLRGLGPGPRITILAPGHGALDFYARDVPLVNGVADLGVIHMVPARAVSGRVLDSDGTPQGWVELMLRQVLDPSDPRLLTRLPSLPQSVRVPDELERGRWVERRTDDLGRFTFPGLSPGTYSIQARPRGRPFVERQFEIKEADLDRLDLIYGEGHLVRIAVSDDAGKPMPRIYVGIRGDDHDGFTYTDSHGVSEMSLPLESVRLYVGSHLPKYWGTQDVIVDVASSAAVFVVRRKATVSGTVIGPNGSPVPGARLAVSHGDAVKRLPDLDPEDPDGPGDPYPIRCDEHGAFTLSFPRGLPTSIVFDGLVQRDGGREWYAGRGRFSGVVDGQSEIVIRTSALPADETLVVKVLDPEGQPVLGATVSTSPRVRGGPCKTGKDGVCTWTGLTEHGISVSVAIEYPPSDLWLSPEPVLVTPGSGDLVLRMQRGIAIEGVVLDKHGKPQADTGIAVHHPSDRKSYWPSFPGAWTDAEGKSRLIVAPNRRSQLTITAWRGWRQGSFSAQLKDVSVEDSPIRIEER